MLFKPELEPGGVLGAHLATGDKVCAVTTCVLLPDVAPTLYRKLLNVLVVSTFLFSPMCLPKNKINDHDWSLNFSILRFISKDVEQDKIFFF